MTYLTKKTYFLKNYCSRFKSTLLYIINEQNFAPSSRAKFCSINIIVNNIISKDNYMTLNELIKNKTKTGKSVEFLKGYSKSGNVIIVSLLKGKKKYVLEASVDNFSRFKDWYGKEATADIRKTGKFFKVEEYGKLPLIQIRIKSNDEIKDDDRNKNNILGE